MPLYRITLACSTNPLRSTSRLVQVSTLELACDLAQRRLDWARSRTYVGKAYDTWRISTGDTASLRKLPLAVGRVR